MGSVRIEKVSITDMTVDCIVNAANEGLRAGGGVCGAIFRTAGHRELQKACDAIGHCDTGKAVITPGFNAKAQYIIHAVGPIYSGGRNGEAEKLAGAYRSSLEVAKANGIKTIAFPLISAGIYGYPLMEAWEVALKTCKEFIEAEDIEVIFAVLDDRILEAGESILGSI